MRLPSARRRRPQGRAGRAADPPLGSASAGLASRRMSALALESLLLGALSLPAKRKCSRTWVLGHLPAGGAALETGNLTRHLQL